MEKGISVLLLCLCLLHSCVALYSSRDEVIELTQNNFDSKVINSDEVWIVEFYAPWCGHCKSLAPEFIKVASALKGVVKVGAVDADVHKSLGGQFGVRGFPTIKIFGANKKSPQDYQGQRTASGLVDAGLKEIKKIVEGRLSGKKSSGGKDSKGSADSVVELTDANFQELVLNSDDLWLVEFFAPWCGHCKNLAPHWANAASDLKGKVKLGALDATEHTVIASRYNVQGYPTIKLFPSGKKDGKAEEYTGGRTADEIVQWSLEKLDTAAPAPEVLQITGEEVLVDACKDHQLCVVSILPHILDCQSSCRNEYLDSLKKVAEKFKKNRWGWIWAEAMAQPELEDNLGIGGFGYPAMAVVNARKMKFSILRGSFGFDGINEFIREVTYGKGSSGPLKGDKLPKIVVTEPWDGKDGELPKEDDYDLDDEADSGKSEL